MEIKVNDIVKVVSRGECYSRYEEYFEKRNINTEGFVFTAGKYPNVGVVAEVLAIEKHLDDDKFVVIINKINTKEIYIYNLCGLEHISSNPKPPKTICLENISQLRGA